MLLVRLKEPWLIQWANPLVRKVKKEVLETIQLGRLTLEEVNRHQELEVELIFILKALTAAKAINLKARLFHNCQLVWAEELPKQQ